MDDVARWTAIQVDDGTAEAPLIAAVQHDPAAFTQIYHLYLDRVYHYLRVRTPTPADAEDLTQQVFLRAWEALPGYQARGVPFAAWLFRIAHNLAADHARRARPSAS